MSSISKPSRYFGVEINPLKKKPKNPSLKICLAFPETYELGMSHYGFLLLYQLLKEDKSLLVDRVFSPWPDRESSLRERKEEIASYEFDMPLSRFDVIGFSLAYELSLTNVLAILDLGGIPLSSRERRGKAPIIIGGGALVANPEPFAAFFDALFIGEGEEGITEMLETVKEGKRSGSTRSQILGSLARIEGVYVPGLYRPVFRGNKDLKGYVREKGAPETIKRRIVADIDKFLPPSTPIFPSAKPVHDRIAIEISRGCTRGCRFCQAGYYYRPRRERKADSVLDYMRKVVLQSGYDEVGLLSLSSSDYSCVNELLKQSMDILEREKISISLPSLRINTISEDLVREVKRVRKGGFTIAPEAGREKLRGVINKDITDGEVLSTVEWIFENGWRTVKMYFMIGLPGEEEEDLYAIRDLSEEALKIAQRRGRRNTVTVSVSTFVPKPHTPFQWAEQISRVEMERKIGILKRAFGRRKNITFKWHSPHMSWLEGIISRGDRRVGKIIEKSFKLGARFDAWSDQLNVGLWERALSSLGMTPDTYTGERRTDEFLPWDIIDTGVTKAFLLREWEKARAGKATEDCSTKGCKGCGVCRAGEIETRISLPLSPPEESAAPEMGERSPLTKASYLVVHRKAGGAASQSALELQSLLSRTLRSSGLPLVFSEGFNPKPKISFPPALPVGIESRAEFFLVTLGRETSPSEILSILKRLLPRELKPTAVIEVSTRMSSLILEERFKIEPDGAGSLPAILPEKERNKIAGIKKVVKRRGNVYVSIERAPGKSAVKSIVGGIFGCTLSDLQIKITKTSADIYIEQNHEKRQIYPHKQQGLRNAGGSGRE
ncbi:MAG: TIGR03960 family B12-binding radical SAM protein [Deltaproteobacteria bacterium]|nr:TIGR03960 family B12-binding radical SAM protein [Deltaproteobacteria bacterium]NIS76302.1 TIGR03960 family B12-binding radical SAM protein [Deltaproteobacteria bacterium]